MKLNGIFYRPLVGGPQHGLYAVVIELGGADAPSFSLTEVVNKVHEAQTSICVIQDHENENDDAELEELVTVLLGSMILAGDIYGYAHPRWVSKVPYLITHITDEPWMMFRSDEIHYHPTDPEVLHVPALGKVNEGGAAKVLVLSKRLDPRQVFTFLSRVTRPWLIVTPSPVEYVIKML